MIKVIRNTVTDGESTYDVEYSERSAEIKRHADGLLLSEWPLASVSALLVQELDEFKRWKREIDTDSCDKKKGQDVL